MILEESKKDFPETSKEHASIRNSEGSEIVNLIQNHDNEKEKMLEKLLEMRFG
jgi:hypothetical protein